MKKQLLNNIDIVIFSVSLVTVLTVLTLCYEHLS